MGSDMGSVHILVTKMQEIRFKKIKVAKERKKWNIQVLKRPVISGKFKKQVENNMTVQGEDMSVKDIWLRNKEVIIESAKRHVKHVKER